MLVDIYLVKVDLWEVTCEAFDGWLELDPVETILRYDAQNNDSVCCSRYDFLEVFITGYGLNHFEIC